MKNVTSIDACQWLWSVVILPLSTKTLTSRKGIDVSE